MKMDFTEIYCHVDDFLKELDNRTGLIANNSNKTGCQSRLNRSEIITIIIGYWQSSYDCFKNYYLKQIWIYHQRDFRVVSYCQFIKLISSYLPLLVLMLNSIMDKCDGISFVDSSSLEVCKRYRISMHKVFAGIAARSKTTKGWFYGLKLHLLVNPGGGIIKESFSSGNKDDRTQLKLMIKGLFGKVFGDRGYISQELFRELLEHGIFMVTRVKKNMKNKLMSLIDKVLLLKRALIESVFSKIKLLGKFEHSRHRSVTNAFVHMVAALISYQLSDNKPSIKSLLQLQHS